MGGPRAGGGGTRQRRDRGHSLHVGEHGTQAYGEHLRPHRRPHPRRRGGPHAAETRAIPRRGGRPTLTTGRRTRGERRQAAGLAPWEPMSRRERSHGHLHVVADPGTPVEAPKPAAGRAPKNGRRNPQAKHAPEPDFGLFPMDEFAPPDPADAQDVPIEDVLRQLEALGLPPDLVAQTRALDDEHRAELAGMLNAATAMLTGDPLAGLIGIWKPLLSKRMTAFDAEMATAEILWNLDAATGDDDLVDGLTQVIDEAEHTGRPEALVMCRMLAHLGPPEVRGRATRAANVMAAGGVKDRPWVSSLGTVTFHRAYGFTDQGGRAVVVEFAYGRRHHAFVFLLDEEEGGVVGLYASD